MKVFDGFRRKRAEKLADRGYELLAEEDFDKALDVAKEVQDLGFSAGFEIAALALAGQERLDQAVRVLEEGVATAPEAWLNWQLLGNYRSDLERYEEAEAAYESALACPDVDSSSVRLNQAILAHRRGDSPKALGLLVDVTDPELALRALAVRMRALEEVGEPSEAEQLGLAALESGREDLEDEALPSIAAHVARLRRDRGVPRQDVRAWVLQMMSRFHAHPDLLTLLREADDLHSESAQYYHLLVKGTLAQPSPNGQGFYVNAHVVADNPEEALRFVEVIETETGARLEVDEAEVAQRSPQEPKGVYYLSGRVWFEEDEEY